MSDPFDIRETPELPFFHPLDDALYGPKDPLLRAVPRVPIDRDEWLRQAIASGGVIDRGEDFANNGHWCRYAYR